MSEQGAEMSRGRRGLFARIAGAQSPDDNGAVLGVALLVIVVGVAAGIAHHRFFSSDNLTGLGYQVGTTATIALGQMIVLGAGAMDLSLGGIGGLAGIVLGGALVVAHFPVPLAVAAAVVLGSLCGLVNGWLVNRFNFSSGTAFIVTLATGTFYAGIALGVTNAIPYYNLPDGFNALSANAFADVPWALLVLVVLAAVLACTYLWSGYGIRNLAVGGDAEAARLSGVRVGRVVLVCFALAGGLASIGAVFYTAEFGAAQPTLGTDWLLPSFAAPILGGTSIAGGKVSVLGTILGALFLAEVTDVLIFLNVPAFWNTFVQGAMILCAVAVDAGRRRALLQLLTRPAAA